MSLYKLSEKIFELEKQGRKIVRLNIGDPGLPTPPALCDASAKAIAAGKTRYASAQGEKALLEKIASLQGCEVKNATVTPGSKWACYALIGLQLKQGGNIVTPTPFWSAYELMAKAFGGSAKLLETTMEERWQFDPEELKEAIDEKTRLVVINNPLNPTSTEYDESAVKAAIEYAQDKKVLVLLDEAYRDLSFRHQRLTQYKEGVAITNTFSKAYCMSGWRAGYMVAPEETTKKIVEMNQITFTNVPLFTQAAMLAGLENRAEVTKATRDTCARRLKLAESIFKGIPYVKPDAGFYMFLKCPAKGGGNGAKSQGDAGKEKGGKACNASDGAIVAEKALEKGVAINPGSSFGSYNDFVRISLSQPDGILEEALKKVREAISGAG